ncbi:MAG: FecR domain-containing protein [Burkholderiales bacterium]|nr:FecR domain-containing protein [Burkholderiales bacterium]
MKQSSEATMNAMRIFAVWVMLGAGLLAATAHAQVAGRVLLAVGEVSALRNGQVVPLTIGATVENRDSLRVGTASSAQIRFSDDSIVALRAGTEFKVENYTFTGREGAGSQAVFNLVRGGFRTLTGLIGRTNRENYLMRTPISTLGIRGTSYTLVLCQQDCFDEDGQLAPDGSYGLVLEGRVAVTNAGGIAEFGADEAFFVADARTPPQPLLSRPGFLRDRLEARQRQRDREAVLAMRREAGDRPDLRKDGSQAPRFIAGTANAPIAAVDLKDESGNIAVLGAGLGLGIGWTAGLEERAQVEGGRGTVIALDGQTKSFDGFKFLANGMSGARGSAPLRDVGGFTGDGGMVWGRWDSGAQISLNSQTFAPPTGVFFVYGNLTPPSALPQPLASTTALQGTLTYDYVGGPRPTDGAGSAGQFLNGSFTVNFLNRTLGGSVAYQVGNFVYNIPVPDGTRLTSNTGYVGFEVRDVNNGLWRNILSNATGSLDATSVGGLFMGSRAQGLGVVFSANDVVAGRTAGAAAFKCRGTRC